MKHPGRKLELGLPPDLATLPNIPAYASRDTILGMDIPLAQSDAFVIAGLSLPVVSLSAWLLHEKFHLRHLHIIATTQGLAALRQTASHAGLPPYERIFWHGEEIDGNDGTLSMTHFQRLLMRELASRKDGMPAQLVLGGGVNWMVSLASQIATRTLSEERGDGLWVIKTEPAFENHPHYLKPDDRAVTLDSQHGITHSPAPASKLQRVPLLRATADVAQPRAPECLEFDGEALRFLGQPVKLPPLQIALYRWLLTQTKLACRRPQLASCEACYACALPAKHTSVLAEDFRRFYLAASAKPGYAKDMDAIDFPRRLTETVSKINANLRKQTNLALFRQLRINHTEGGYLPGVDKNYLKGG